MRAIHLTILAVVCLFFLVEGAKGQTLKATIVGVVTDGTGAVIPGAEVTAVQTGTNFARKTITNDQGSYELALLEIGDYVVSVELTGFKKTTVSKVVLTVGQTERVDVRLQVGEIAQTVEVTAQNPVLHTDEATISKQVSGNELRELPLLSRDVTQLQLLAAGATPGYGAGGNLGIGLGTGVTVNGGRITQGTSVTYDGGDNTNEGLYHAAMRPSVESVAEVRYQTGVYSAEHGRAPANMAIVSKSGTNDFHGSGFWFFQDESLNARSFFAKTRPEVRVNQYGYSFGGPVIKEKLFFFTNFDGFRNRTPAVYNQAVPSDQFRSGNFSALGKPIIDPLTNEPFPGNVIPANRIGKFGKTVVDQLLPKANDGDFWRESASNQNDRSQFGGRLDYHWSDEDLVFGRYTIEDLFSGAENVGQPLLPQFYDLRFQNLVLGETHTFSPRDLNDFRFTFHRENVPIVGPEPRVEFLREVGVTGLEPHNPGYPQISVTNYGFWGEYAVPSKWAYNTFQLDDTMTLIRGGHSLKTGLSVRRFQANQFRDAPGSRGAYTFSGLITGDGLADMLLGHPTQVSWGPPAGAIYDRFSYWAGFLQDDWKISPRLTASLGLRYDLFTRQKEKYNRIATVDPGSGKIVVAGDTLPANLEPRFLASFPAGTVVPASQIPGLPVDTLRGGDHNNFSPRLGFAYRPFDTRTVIRGGYGIYYSLPDEFGNTEPGARLAPWQNYRTIISTKPDIDINNPFANITAPTLQLPSGRYHGGPEFRDGYIHQYSLGIEREILTDTVFEISYVGSKGRNLEANILNYNNAPPGDANTVQQRRRFPNLGPITYVSSWGTSDYNSMQLRMERRYVQNLTFSTSYTWGKAMFNTAQGPNANNVFDPLRLNAWRSPGLWDITHRFVGDWIWALPAGRGQRFVNRGGVLDALVGGWMLTGIATMQSGVPYSITSSQAAILSGTGTQIGMPADRTGSGELPASARTLDKWFDTSAFKRPQPATFGNAGLAILRADGQVRFDLGLFKNFRIREGHVLQFRSEFFNAFNHADFSAPNGNVDSSTFGKVTGSTGARAIQFAFKYTF